MGSTSRDPFGLVLGEMARSRPDAPAITCEGRTVSRIELESASNRLARAYMQLGVTQGDFVSIGLPNGIEFTYQHALSGN